jgi:hypothetical protein
MICNVEKLLAITTRAWVTSACRRYQDPGGTSRCRDGYAYNRFHGCASSGERRGQAWRHPRLRRHRQPRLHRGSGRLRAGAGAWHGYACDSRLGGPMASERNPATLKSFKTASCWSGWTTQVCESEGRNFESCRAYRSYDKIKIGKTRSRRTRTRC